LGEGRDGGQFAEPYSWTSDRNLPLSKPGRLWRKYKMIFATFGDLAIMVSQGDSRPIALRHQLSPALPFSDVRRLC